MPAGRPPLYTKHEEIENIIQEYFDSVTTTHPETGVKIFRPTLSGLAIALDMDRKSLYNYGKKEEFFPTIKKARGKVEEALESNLYNNGVAGTIFNLKNNFDWVDKTERENSGTTNVLIGHKDASVL